MASVSISCPSCSATDGVVRSDRLLAWRKEVSRRFQRDAETGKPLPRKGP
ncbi:hypothetical protein FHB04_08430 [Escherichia coli]|nr:hypothetical protein [Escherichia coli]